ncbi:MAG: hypothetical protein ACO20H_13805 [Bacteriovoracaceae bacterium]
MKIFLGFLFIILVSTTNAAKSPLRLSVNLQVNDDHYSYLLGSGIDKDSYIKRFIGNSGLEVKIKPKANNNHLTLEVLVYHLKGKVKKLIGQAQLETLLGEEANLEIESSADSFEKVSLRIKPDSLLGW